MRLGCTGEHRCGPRVPRIETRGVFPSSWKRKKTISKVTRNPEKDHCEHDCVHACTRNIEYFRVPLGLYTDRRFSVLSHGCQKQLLLDETSMIATFARNETRTGEIRMKELPGEQRRAPSRDSSCSRRHRSVSWFHAEEFEFHWSRINAHYDFDNGHRDRVHPGIFFSPKNAASMMYRPGNGFGKMYVNAIRSESDGTDRVRVVILAIENGKRRRGRRLRTRRP